MFKSVVCLALLTLCLVVVLPVTAMAQTSEPHYACTSGDWDGTSVWKANAACTGDYIDEPDSTDPVIISSGKTVDVNVAVASCRSIDVESTATVNIETGNELEVTTVASADTSFVDGTVYLKGDDSRFQFLGLADHTLRGSGEVIGEHEQARFDVKKVLNFDFTTEIVIRGKLQVAILTGGVGVPGFTFTNHGTWHADSDGIFVIAVGGLIDNSTALYKVSTNALAVMEPRDHAGPDSLKGNFEVRAGQLKCMGDLTTTGKLTQTGGTIYVQRGAKVVFSETP